MKAVWYEKQGDASEVLIYGEVEKPTPQNNEVLIKVHYSGLNPSDTKRRIGFRGQKHAFHSIIPHSDGSGIIEAVGSNIDSKRIGERVWVYSAQWQRPFGTAANFVCVPSNLAIKLEDSISLEIGATIGIPALISVLNVSEIWATSDFKIRSPNNGDFKIKLSKNLLPGVLE